MGANNPRAKVRGSGGGDAGILGGPLGLEDQDLESQQVEKSLFEKHAMSRDKLDEHREKALIASSTNENIKQNTRDSSAPSLQQTLFAAERNIDGRFMHLFVMLILVIIICRYAESFQPP